MGTIVKSQIWMQEVLKNSKTYEYKFVVHNATTVLFASENLRETQAWVKDNEGRFEEELSIFLVPNDFGAIRLRMLKIKSLSSGEWTPTYPVQFIGEDGAIIKIEMIVDSGADVTFIPKKIGQQLGFVKSHGEAVEMASGVGSKVSYLVRKNAILINDIELNIHLLWGQDDKIGDILLGRMDVFEHFDVTFSQSREKIIFTPVPKKVVK
jgi:gag-polyprotein putative aspartyl protease